MSRLGFFLFAGLLGGAVLANFLVGLPAIGALAGAAIGAVAAYLLDKKSSDK